MKEEAGPGVPEALPRVLKMLDRRLGGGRMDRIWIFPPRIRGRREDGLVAVSVPVGEGGGHRLFTAPYTAERTGRALYFDVSLTEEGEAPADRLPRVMTGVVERAEEDLGDPEEVVIEGDPARFDEMMAEFDAALFEEEAVPHPPEKSLREK